MLSSQPEHCCIRKRPENQAYLNGGATALNAKLDEPVKSLQVLSLQKHLQAARSENGTDAVPAAITALGQ
jgi:hypothetical protein